MATPDGRPDQRLEPRTVNGAPGLGVLKGGHLMLVASTCDGRVHRVDLVLAPPISPACARPRCDHALGGAGPRPKVSSHEGVG